MSDGLVRPEDREFIPNQWYGILRTESLKTIPIPVQRLGMHLVLWRDNRGKAHCADAACPHRGTNLGHGRVVDGELECRYHGFRFGSDGHCSRMPCEGRDAPIPKVLCLRKHFIREEFGFLWLWYGTDHSNDLPTINWAPEAPIQSVGSAHHEEVWDVRYSRVMEAMLDLHHFSFAHRPWLPSGYTRLDPFEVRFQDNILLVNGTLRSEGEKKEKQIQLEYGMGFPGMLHLKLGKRIQGVVICAPVDPEHTWIAVRYHHSNLPIPGIGYLFVWLALQFEFRIIQPKDYLMVHSAQPRSSAPLENHFVHANRAIAEWHRLRSRAFSGDLHRNLDLRSVGISEPIRQ